MESDSLMVKIIEAQFDVKPNWASNIVVIYVLLLDWKNHSYLFLRIWTKT